MIKKAILEDLKINLFITIPLFLIMYFSSKNALQSLGIFIFLLLFLTIWSYLSIHLGYKRHFQIIESDGFKKLLLKGFKIERVNKYIGINGTYNNYLFDIYYDWNAITTNSKNTRALVLNIYFETPKLSNNETDHDSLKKMSEKYKNSYWTLIPKTYIYRWREGNILMNNSVGLKNPSYEFITQRMDMIIELMKTEKLHPIEREKVIEMRNNKKLVNIPEIEVYYKNIR